MTYVKVQTTYATTDRDFIGGLKMVKAWEDWADDYNEAVAATAAAAPPSAGAFVPPKAMVYVPTAGIWKMTVILGQNAVANTLLALALAFCVVLGATFNWIIAAIAVVNVGFIVTIIFGCFFAFGWQLGLLESILCVIVVGFAIDFSLHLVDSYLASDGMLGSAFASNDERQSLAVGIRASAALSMGAGGSSGSGGASNNSTARKMGGSNNRVDFDDGDASMRYERVREALSVTGVSIVSGSLSTLLATFPMFFTQITFFSKFGTVMFMTM